MRTRLKIDADRLEVFADGKRVHLKPTERNLLFALRKSNKALTRAQLLEEVCGIDSGLDVQSRTIDQHVSRLRAKFKFPIVETVTGHGYRIAAGL